MSYKKDGLIEAQPDFNTFANAIGDVKGDALIRNPAGDPTFGYGQFPVANAIPVGKVVAAAEWNQLLSDIHLVAEHLDIDSSWLPSTVEEYDDLHEAGNDVDSTLPSEIRAIGDPFQLLNFVNQLSIARFNVAVSSLARTSIDSQSSTRTTLWDNEIKYGFNVTFANKSEARYFFNTGGRIDLEIEYTLPNNPSELDIYWEELISNVDILPFAYSGVVSPVVDGGFYQLTSQYEVIFFKQGGGGVYGGAGAYGAENVSWRVKETDGSNYVINFEFICTSALYKPVNGTMLGVPSITRSVTPFNVSSPTLTKVIDFSDSGATIAETSAAIVVSPSASQTCNAADAGCENTYTLTASDENNQYLYAWDLTNASTGFSQLSSTTNQVVTISSTGVDTDESALISLVVTDRNNPKLSSSTTVVLNSRHVTNDTMNVSISTNVLEDACVYDQAIPQVNCALLLETQGTEFIGNATGGSGSYTYDWQITSGDVSKIGFVTIGNDVASGPSVRVVSSAANDQSFTVSCTATDTNTAISKTTTFTKTHQHTDISVELVLDGTMGGNDSFCGIGSNGEECSASNTVSVFILQGSPTSYRWSIDGDSAYKLKDPETKIEGSAITTSGPNALVYSVSGSNIGTYTVECTARAGLLASNTVTSGPLQHHRVPLGMTVTEISNNSPQVLSNAVPVSVESNMQLVADGIQPYTWDASVDTGNITSIDGVGIPDTDRWMGTTPTNTIIVGVESVNSKIGNTPVTLTTKLSDGGDRPGDPLTNNFVSNHMRERDTFVIITNLDTRSYTATESGNTLPNLKIVISTDGKWQMSTTASNPSGNWDTFSQSSGDWAKSSDLDSSKYEARLVMTGSTNNGVFSQYSNQLASWTQISDDLVCVASLGQSKVTAQTDTYSHRLEIRSIGMTAVLASASFEWTINAPKNGA